MHSIDNEHGSVIVFVTLMIVLLLIMVGIGLDTGQLTATRSQGQAAVDAAALAAVSGLPVQPNPENEVNQRVAAFNASNDYIKKSSNPITRGNITYVKYDETTGAITNLPGIATANGVRVALETNSGTAITTPVFLTPLMNLFGQSAPSTVDVNVSAIAVLRAVPSVPIAIKNEICNGTTTVSGIKLREKGKPENSCWTTYTDSPPTLDRVRTLLDASKSCSGLPANTERITSGTKIEMDNNTDRSTYALAKDLFRGSPPGACWVVPVIKSGNNCITFAEIVDWATICPTPPDLSINVVESDTEGYVKADLTCGQNQNLFRSNSNLCFSPRLVRDTKSGM